MSSLKRQKEQEIRRRICRNVDKIIQEKYPTYKEEELASEFAEKKTTLRSYRGFNRDNPTVSLEFLIKFSLITGIPIDDLVKKNL